VSREAALDYAATRGWPVFPVSADGKKRPLIKDWGNAASLDPGQIERWWKRWPQALVGVPCGRRTGFVVLDIYVKDPRAYGFDTLGDLGLAILPETPMAHTRSGGLHLYFACHATIEIRNSIGRGGFGPGVDVRGNGGFVVLPSPGSRYWWDPHLNFDTCTPQPAPAWLGHRSRQVSKVSGKSRRFDAASVLEEACDNIRGAFIVGCLVRDRHVPEGRARHELDAAVLALQGRCRDYNHAVQGYETAFAEGLCAPRRVRA
jgi:hypothetical protein